MLKILFVCMGNICRSPMAEGVTRVLAKQAGMTSGLHVDSAGTHASHVGEQADPRARRAAGLRGYDLSGLRARCVEARDFMRFDRILAMDRQNLAWLRRACPDEHYSKLGLFLPYAEGLAVDEIPDPYFGGSEGFEKVLDLCEQAARGLIHATRLPCISGAPRSD